MSRYVWILAAGFALTMTCSIQAQDAVLSQLYGAGVHSYYSGDYAKAHEEFSKAILSGTQDPRAFFYRGLACMQLGRSPDAKIDFQKGAALEMKDANKVFNVPKALERIQGSARQQIEVYRSAARLASMQKNEQFRKARYEAVKREEQRVLRTRSFDALTGTTKDAIESIPSPEGNPAASTAKTGEETKPAAGEEAAKDDPFGATSAEEKKDEMKAEATEEKTEEKKEEKKAEEDPFAT